MIGKTQLKDGKPTVVFCAGLPAIEGRLTDVHVLTDAELEALKREYFEAGKDAVTWDGAGSVIQGTFEEYDSTKK